MMCTNLLGAATMASKEHHALNASIKKKNWEPMSQGSAQNLENRIN